MEKKIFSRFVSSFLIAASMIFFAVGIDAQSKKDIKKANQLVDQGNKEFRAKNYRTAIERYAESIVLVPKNSTAHFWKGYAHYYLKETDPAIGELDTAIAQGYKPLDVYKVRWFLNYDKKNYDAALSDVREGLALEPNNLMFLIGAGEIYYGKAQYKEALDAYQRAAAINPNSADLHFSIARTQYNLGNTAGQVEAAGEAVKRGTQFLGEAYFILADGQQKLRHLPEAAEAYLRTIDIKPDTYAAYRNLADIYRSQNRFTDAIEVSKKGLRAFPNDGNIYTDLSWYYSLADRNDEAIQAAIAGTKLLPTQSLAYTNLCRAYNDTKQFILAINACNAALKISPNDGETSYYLGRAYDLLGRASEATKHYDQAVAGLEEFTKNNPEYSDGYYLLGNAYYADEQREKAIGAYLKCLELSPKFVKARYNLGFTYIKQRNKAGAVEQYNSLLSMDQSLATKLKAEIDKL